MSEIWQAIVRGFKSLFGSSTSNTTEPSERLPEGVAPLRVDRDVPGGKAVRYPSTTSTVLRKSTGSYSNASPTGYGYYDIYNPNNPFAWTNPASPYYRSSYVYSAADHPYGTPYPEYTSDNIGLGAVAGGAIGSAWNDRLDAEQTPAPAANGAALGNDETASTPGVVDTSNIGGGSYADDTKATETDSLTGQPFDTSAPDTTSGGSFTPPDTSATAASKSDLDSASDLAGGGWGPSTAPDTTSSDTTGGGWSGNDTSASTSAPSTYSAPEPSSYSPPASTSSYDSGSSSSGSSYSGGSSSSSYDSGSLSSSYDSGSSSSSSSSSDSGGGW